MVHRLRTFILVLFLWCNYSQAQEPLEITIHAFRSASDLEHRTYSYEYHVPDSYKDFKKTPSVNIVQSGPQGQMSSTFLRGTNSNHTLLTLNGMPIKDHSTPTGVDDISQHSMIGINSVEIIKGPMATVYGANAVGGVINMTSYATDEKYAELTSGSNGTLTQKIKYGNYYNGHLIDLAVENKSSEGISVYSEGSEKDGYDTKNYNIKTTSNIGQWWINTNLNSKYNEADLDSSGSDTLNYTSDWHFKNQYIDILNNDTKLAFNNVTHEREYNKAGSIDTYDSNTKTFLGTHTINVKETDITVGSEFENIKADFDTSIDGYVSSVDKERNNKGIFINSNTRVSDNLLLNLGTRFDHLSSFKDQQTHRVGLAYKGWRSSYSTAYKSPTVYEMYGRDNFGFLGNAYLTPETSKTYEVGYGDSNFDIVFYNTEIDNLIVYRNSTYQNDSATSTRKGSDVTLTAHKGNIRFLNKTSYVIAQDSSGNLLTRRPKWTNNLEIDYTKNNYRLTANWNHYGKHKDIDSSTYLNKDMSAVDTIDIGTEYNFGANTKIFFKMNNVLDKKYERPDGYAQDTRTFTLGFKQNF